MTTVLIADDEFSLRLLVNATIASEQYTVVEAADGDEAWRLLLEHRPTVALLDVQMPGRTGLELTRAIKAHPELAGTYVVLLTSQAQETDVRAGLAAGADHYLTKPFSLPELVTVVQQALQDAALQPDRRYVPAKATTDDEDRADRGSEPAGACW